MINKEAKWIPIEDAALYLGIGKTNLYAMARDGHIPARRIGKKWLFDRTQLDTWARLSTSIKDYFTSVEANIEENPQIREPQREAYQQLYDFFKSGKRIAIVQIPVGCGKSGLAAIIPFGVAKGRVLIITPNLTIKDGLYETLDITNRQKCFWSKRKVLKPDDMIAGPYVSTLDIGNISVCEKSHIVVTNVQQLATNTEKWLDKFSDDFFDLIIIDEAHHSAAESWKKVIEKFSSAKILSMTATPFRSDKQEIEGDLIYRYPFKRATLNGYVKLVRAWYVAPSELEFNARGETKVYTLDDVLEMKDKDWFSRGIALSEVCNRSIVDSSIEKLEELRQTGTRHQLIAVACSVDHAKSIRSLYEERGYKADVIHSKMDEQKQDEVMLRLRSGELDCIVQVQMLGEGFDHPKLSVAAIFRPFRSLAPYIQFVGRILRVVVQNDPTHPDNFGHVVTHSGMNLDQRLREFQLFESDDQKFWEDVIGGIEPELPRQVMTGEARLLLRERAFVNYEIVESLIGENLTTVDDQDIIRDLEKKLEALGLDPKDAEMLVTKQKRAASFTPATAPLLVLPQRQWEEARKRLHEQVKRSANLMLNRLNLDRGGRKIVKTGVPAANDFVALIQVINKEIKQRHPTPREEWSSDKFKKVIEELEDIMNVLTKRYKGILK